MLSLFYKILETKIPDGIFITIFKPNKENQIILIKGKLGQFKLIWDCANAKGIDTQSKTFFKGQKNEDDHLSLQRGNINLDDKLSESTKNLSYIKESVENENLCLYTKLHGRIWTENYTNEIEFLAFKKENKRLLYNQKTKKIKDLVLAKTRIKKDIKQNRIDIFEAARFCKYISDLESETKPENMLKLPHPDREFFRQRIHDRGEEATKQNTHNESNKIYMGYLIALKNFKPINQKETSVIKLKENPDQEPESPLAGWEWTEMSCSSTGEEKILNKQIKNIIIGITQGFSTNLELKGIGYQAKIEEREATGFVNIPKTADNQAWKEDSKKRQSKTEWNEIGQLESNLNRSKKNNFNKGHTSFLGGACRKNVEKKELKKNLILNIGTSHNIVFPLSEHEIVARITTSPNNFVTLSILSISRYILNQIAANIYLLKKPEPYKGKGIRYDNEKFFSKEKTKKS